MSRWRVAAYGVTLALLAWLLAWLDFRTRVRAGSSELYVAAVAIVFTGLGAWVGRRLTRGTGPRSPFVENRRAVEALGISDRELELLGLLAEGRSNKEIARQASISVNTVKTHLSSLYGKLEVSRRTQAVRKARELGILP